MVVAQLKILKVVRVQAVYWTIDIQKARRNHDGPFLVNKW